MKIKTLIQQLQEIEKDNPNVDVCILDWRKSAANSNGDEDGSAIGIYDDLTVELVPQRYRPKGSTDWVSLSFDNDDYETVSN